MTIREYLAYLDREWDESDNRACLSPLVNALCPVSMETLRGFQFGWDGNKPFKEFVAAQNAQIKECVEMELSPIGDDVRAALGLRPLTLDADLAEPASRPIPNRM